MIFYKTEVDIFKIEAHLFFKNVKTLCTSTLVDFEMQLCVCYLDEFYNQ